MIRQLPRSPLFPYTTLFRSVPLPDRPAFVDEVTETLRTALADADGKWTARSPSPDRKSTRLNSSHLGISYAVFCLKKKRRIRSATTPDTHCAKTIARHPTAT